MKKFTIDYFIKKFEKIPSRLWIAGTIDDGKGRKCALGHCGEKMINAERSYSTDESIALYSNISNGLIISVNDGTSSKYLQKTPKGRVLAYLRDLKKCHSQEVF